MLLDKHIGFDSEDGQGIDGSLFAKELLLLDSMDKKSIKVYINSVGGSVIDGMSIYNAILNSKTPVDTYNVGVAASMAGVCFMAGRKRIMADYAKLMIHNPSGSDDKKVLESLGDSIKTMLSAKSMITPDAVGYLMEKTTWLGSSECLEKGFATDIQVTSEANNKRMPQQNAKAMWKVAADIVNSALNTSNNKNMTKVTNALKLNDAANEDAIVAAIDGLKNELETVKNTAKTEKEDLQKDLQAAQDKVKEIEDKLKDSETELEAAKSKAEAEEKKATELKADELVNSAARIGKITNTADAKAVWKEKAVNDFEGTKKLIDSLPLNKVSNKVEATDVTAAIKSAGTAQGIMLAIENNLKEKK